MFLDTNVLLYAVDNADPAKHRQARQRRAELWKSGNGRTSFQVLEEFYVNVCTLMPEARESARAEICDPAGLATGRGGRCSN
jgi:predicted nucleic acid-binding protein